MDYNFHTRNKAIMFMILSCLGFSMMQICVKLTGGRIPLFEQVFFRNIITLIICGTMVMRNNSRFLGTKKSRPYLLIRSVLGFMGVVLYFYAINNMNIADATILQKSSPLFVIIFATILLKQKLTKSNVITMFLCFIGAILVIRPQLNSDIIPALLALLSAAFAGGAYTAVSYVSKMEGTNTIIFFFSLVSSILCIPMMVTNFVMPTLWELMVLILIGVFAGIGQIFLTLGYKYAPATQVSIYNYSTIIFSAILGFLFFGDVLHPLSILGILVIFSSSYYQFKRG